ncbi:NAD(P)-binding domain-containing protein [Salinicola acroporae]|uniref:NAD(P)-binding domain-containing protein n=1 Tax=Salinicola acroporae TaxID=1541440 RepID=UPI002457D733|nr:NAD(P)-binding domain-containing protein [Salinicola acroporae]
MDLAMVGLGRMGANMAERLVRSGHRVVGVDPSEEARARAADKGIEPAVSLAAAVDALPSPRVVWLMVPAGPPVDKLIAELEPLLAADDVIIDGGNSMYKDTLRRAAQSRSNRLHYVDVGTSGGVWGSPRATA